MTGKTKMSARYKITVAYDGSAFFGWQVQPSKRTVQEDIEKAIHRLTGETVKVHGSGRTDQGVHARAQMAHLDLEQPLSGPALRKALNALLPPDIRIAAAAKAAPNFHARRSAREKEDRYFIWNAEIVPPFLRLYRTHVRGKLDAAAMAEAAKLLVGNHDFAAFTANPNRVVESTVRHLSELRVARRGPEIVISARSNGFLYKMVRSLCGFLIRVGEGAVPPSEARHILTSQVRTARVPTAPPEGLFLWRVTY